jgi:glycerol-3-phosphate dehydrogenase (NAD(P)+)
MSRIGIVGAGAWGTALGINLAAHGHHVALWGRDVERLIEARQNSRYLPGIIFPEHLSVVGHMEALGGCDPILLAVPAQTQRSIVRQLSEHIAPDARLVVCAKGIEKETGLPLAAVVNQEMPQAVTGILSGPTFACEVANGLPTAATLAMTDARAAEELAAQLSNPTLRLYHSGDVIGVCLAGALKNVIAIACGIVMGAGLGENARAALMTRGLAGITQLAMKLGARPETMTGLAGFGDMALTCSSMQSRNFSYGFHIGQGMALERATAGKLAEGAATAEAVRTLAGSYGIEMPIAEAVHAILSGTLDIHEAAAALMGRPLKPEHA